MDVVAHAPVSDSQSTAVDPTITTSGSTSSSPGSTTATTSSSTSASASAVSVSGDRATAWPSWVKFDFVKRHEEALGEAANAYVRKWLDQKWLPSLCANPVYHSFFNHKDIRKEFSESWAIYKQVKLMLASMALPPGVRLVLFDVCSGKGFSGVLLAHKFPSADVIMIDKNFRINAKHLVALPRVRMQVMDILKDPELLPYFVFGCLPPNSIGILTGMHLCGPLSKSFIHCFSVVEQIASMILCPCCLESHKKSGIAAEARSLNVDNYLHWTSHLLQSLPQESLRTTCIQDEHILTIKNKIITATRLKLTFNPTPLSSLLSSIQQTESTKPPKQKAVCLYKLASEDPDFQGASAVIAKRFTWCAIDGCPGRYTLSPGQITGSDGISALVTAAGLDPKITVQPEVVGSSIRARDPVTTAAFINTTPDSTASASTQSNNSYGGFISYRHSNGSYLHTLCTASGFARKKNQLGL